LDTSSPDFVDLYRILDLIQDNVGASNVSERGWCSTRAISRFTQTANSPTAIGDAARHGREHSHPPSRPMTLAEARRLIFGLAEHWLDWRADEPQEQ
jgi:hypothetical protein